MILFNEFLGMNVDLPKISGGGAGLSANWALILAIIIILIVGGVAFFIYFRSKTYKYKIILFENISGQGYQPVLKDRARLIKIGDGGEEVLYLAKKKVFRTAYGRKMGKNTYWFAVGQDGYWYNITLGDLDAKMGMLDIEPIDRDMRYMHVAVRRNAQERYQKQKFMEKYGAVVMLGAFLLIMLIGLFILLGKMGDIATANAGAISKSEKLVEAQESVLNSLDNILNNPSTIVQIDTSGGSG